MNTTKKAAPAALLLAAACAHGQVVTDGTVGARVTLSGHNVVIPDSLGLRAGTNLLHSFSTFNVGAGERATFVGVGFVQNIIARITGGSASHIDGTVASSIPGSNLFLVNPSGLVFGPGAAIDVPGSFHASTAHYLKLADGTRVAMSASHDVTLTFAPPAAFGFEGAAAPIALQGAQLRVNEGRRISLAGGDVTLEAANGRAAALTALSGTIGIVAAQSAGEAAIDPGGLRAEGFGAMGRLAIRGGSGVNVNEGPARQGAGAISLAGGNVVLDHAALTSNTTVRAGRGIDIRATDAITIAASDVLSTTRGAGDAGGLSLRARDITLSGGSLVDTSCDPGCTTGAGGPITVVADRNLVLVGDNPELPTYLVSNSFGAGRTGTIDIRAGALAASGNALIQGNAAASGDGTTLTLTTGSILLTSGAQVEASTLGSGRGGTLTVNNSGAIRIDGTRIDGGFKAPSGLFANSNASGAAGAIVVATGSLEILGGGEISSSSRRGSTGNGGRIVIAATGVVRVSGTDGDPLDPKSSVIASNTLTGAAAGDVEIVADSLEVDKGGRIQVLSEGAGAAGSVRIEARTVTLASQGQVSSEARSTGAGGSLHLVVRETLAIDGGVTGLFAATRGGPARGGSIRVSAGNVRLTGGGTIFAASDTSFASGGGGDIVVHATENVEVSGDASISVQSFGPALAGTIDVHAGDTLLMTSNGRINTSARQADGGDVRVSAGRFGFIDGGRITTEVGTGQGSGGNVDLRIPTLVMRAATITANAFGGDGGNIRIGTTTFLPSPDSRITASSTLGIDGTITFESPALDPTGELIVPPPAFLDAGAVLAGRCGPRLAGRASSLVVAPRFRVAEAPDGWRLGFAPDSIRWSQPLVCLVASAGLP